MLHLRLRHNFRNTIFKAILYSPWVVPCPPRLVIETRKTWSHCTAFGVVYPDCLWILATEHSSSWELWTVPPVHRFIYDENI